MPTFLATSPDGRKFRITAPEGATKEQLEAYAQKNLPAAPEQPAAPQSKLDILKQFWAEQKPGLGPLGLAKGLYETARTLPQTLQQSLPPSSKQGFVPTDPERDLARIAATTKLGALASPSTPGTLSAMGRGVIPTQDALKSAKNEAYATFRDTPVTIKPEHVLNLYEDTKQSLLDKEFVDFNQPRVFRNIEELKGDLSAKNVELVRRRLGKIKGDPEEMAAAAHAREKLGDFLANLKPEQVEGGNVKGMQEAIAKGRSNYAALMRSETITDAIEAAKLRASTGGSGANIENTLRQELRNIVSRIDKGTLRGWTKDERDALAKAAGGGPLRDLMRLLGKGAPTGTVSALPTMAGLASGHGAPAAAAQLAAFIPKKIGEHLTKRAAQRADELVRSRSPLAQPGQVKPSDIEAFLRSLGRPRLAETPGSSQEGQQ